MRSLALLPVLAATLAVAPAAGATTLKLPAPPAGEVAVAAVPVSGDATLKVAKSAVPKGAAVTGGVVKHVALIAVIRPRGSATVRAAAGGPKLRGGASATAVLGAAPSAALTAAVAPACAQGAAAKALGHALRRGAGAPPASDLAALGKLLAARLCGGAVGDQGTTLLGLLRLKVPAAPVGAASVVAPAGAAPSTAPPTASAPSRPPPPSATTTPPPAAGTPQCANGKDDDGDGQADALATSSAPFFDPGCSGASDASEDSEKTLPAACSPGVVTQGSRAGFGVQVDSRTNAACPKAMVKGIVDLASPATGCENPGWDGGHGNGASSQDKGVCVNQVAGDLHQGDAWSLNGVAAANLCDTRAVAVSYTADDTAWERDTTIADPVGACSVPAPPAAAPQCADGIDNDFDGQIDTGGAADSGPDPGCASAADAGEAEADYPATGCWNYVAADPDDATVAWVYVMPRAFANSCPTMDAAAISFTYLHVKSCATAEAYWDGAAAGTCTIKNGDAWLGGGSGQRIAVALQLDEAIGCDTYVQGQVDMRTAGTWREGITETATIVGDHLEECPYVD
jgi:hypothetical protein